MKFTKDKAFHFKKAGIDGWVYVGKDDFPPAGVVLVETEKGHNTVIKSTRSAWIYFIIEGKGKFVINGRDFVCEEEDVILIPRDSPFYYQGNLKMLLITIPAWEEKYEVTLEKVKDLIEKK